MKNDLTNEPAAGEQAGAVAQGLPSDEDMREGFRKYDWDVRGARHKTPWQLWRDGACWANRQALAAPGAAIAAREQDAIDRAAWAKLAAKAHGWTDDSTPPMVDGRFETGWHESEFQTFMQGVRHGRS